MRKLILPLVVVLIAVAMVFAVVVGMSTENAESALFIADGPVVVADVEVLAPSAVDLEPPAEIVDNRRPTAPAESRLAHDGMYTGLEQTAANILRTGRSFGAGVCHRPIGIMQRVDNITRTGRSLRAGVYSTQAPLGVG